MLTTSLAPEVATVGLAIGLLLSLVCALTMVEDHRRAAMVLVLVTALSSRKVANGRTSGDAGGVSLIDGSGTYAKAFRAAKGCEAALLLTTWGAHGVSAEPRAGLRVLPL
jgi:hypothetical protein